MTCRSHFKSERLLSKERIPGEYQVIRERVTEGEGDKCNLHRKFLLINTNEIIQKVIKINQSRKQKNVKAQVKNHI